MRIKKITIKNFKFHQNLEPIILEKKNCLIYGENGSGKSSIYWALYPVFKKYFRNSSLDFNKFRNIDIDDLGVKIELDNNVLKIPNREYNLPLSIGLNNFKTIYFVNQNLLSKIINSRDENFYNSISLYLKRYFNTIDTIYKSYEEIKSSLTSQNHIEKIEESKAIDNIFEKKLKQMELRANDIIQNHFKEDFEIRLKFEAVGINSDELLDELKCQNPNITILINEKSNLNLYFNEAKLKLVAIAIFFSLIKLEEERENPLKLLVLDDFLTSLDMANRHYIIEYIFKNFKRYQIILFTHNLQFYHLILDWLNTNNQENRWDIKNIYMRRKNHTKVILKSLIFYRKIVLNRASHDNPDVEIYRREYANSIRVIEELGILLEDLKRV